MFTDDDLIPISALQHTLFCERQCALIHVERLWEENLYTAEGRVLHERVDVEHHESRKAFKMEYALALRSLEWGLVGKADVVEFRRHPDKSFLSIVPVEYKRGSDKEDDCDRVQLCAQALCLEEMFQIEVPLGQFYYLKDHRRTDESISADLRQKTLAVIQRTREILEQKITPLAQYKKSTCDRCSLVEWCMPKVVGSASQSVSIYLQKQREMGSHA